MAEEKSFENRIKRYLESKGIKRLGSGENRGAIGYYEKRHADLFTSSGLPDLHIVINGKSIDVEVKAAGGKVSPLQRECVKQILACGSEAFVMYPEDFCWLKKVIDRYADESFKG